jgi:divalent metal cation (Fe/Co/Zn/Cd) transporter
VSVELLDAPTREPAPPAAPVSRPEWLRLARRARALSWLSLALMSAEAGVAITAGIIASSIALIGFGIDSLIEGVASLVIVWRFSGSRLHSETAERRAQRLVAIQFFLLAPYVTIEALRALIAGHHPDASWVGIGLATASAVTMPALGIAKQRIAEGLGSVATRGEGQQNMLCAYLASALLVGLLGNALLGLWWLDPAVGLLIAAVAVREGIESWRGEGCCAPAATPRGDAGCTDACCAD